MKLESIFSKSILTATLLLATATAEAQLNYKARDFKYLYNTYRVAQANPLPWPANFWPYFPEKGDQKGSGINAIPEGHQMSPAQKYDLAFNTGGKAAAWEEENHTCKGITGDQLKECKGWYGHCNGWSGAAIHHNEPSYDQTYRITNSAGQVVEFNYMDVKALLSELWLDVNASFDGTGMVEKADAWIFDPNSAMGKKPADNDPTSTNYEAYWDVTPRALFWALTNYIGKERVGIDIDRFSGSEIWNQPVIAYRFLPIKGNLDKPVEKNGRLLYPVTFGVKLYWANDDVKYDFKSKESLKWDINNPAFSNDNIPNPVDEEKAQDKTPDEAFISRYVQFILFFDQPVQVTSDGKQIISGGKVVGDGMWAHADPNQKAVWFRKGWEKAQWHPDFIWRADSLSERDYRNPHIKPEKVYGDILKLNYLDYLNTNL